MYPTCTPYCTLLWFFMFCILLVCYWVVVSPSSPLDQNPPCHSTLKTTLSHPLLFLHHTHTDSKMELILRSIQQRLQMQFSMARKFTLRPSRRYSVKHSKRVNMCPTLPKFTLLPQGTWGGGGWGSNQCPLYLYPNTLQLRHTHTWW